MNRMLIGILGRKWSGKDTVSDYLVANHNFKKISFAQPLKDACGILFNFNHEQLHGNLKEVIDPNWGVTPRKVMQFIGTDIFRNNIDDLLPNIGDNFWVQSAMSKYAQSSTSIVISDVRFQNEINSIHEHNGIVIKLNRTCIKNNDDHSSEKNIDKLIADYEIMNDGTLDSLYKNIELIVSRK